MLINLQSNSDYTWAYEIKIEIKKKKRERKFGSSRIRTRDELVARISPCLSIT